MLLALDVGNSSISVGVFTLSHEVNAEPALCCHFKISNKSYSADEYVLLIQDFLARNQICAANQSCATGNDRVITCSVISSVVPDLTDLISDAAQRLCGQLPLRIDQGVRTGFGIRVRNPEQLGSDIVANTAAALKYAKPPIAILDMGTATTLTIVSTNVELIGTIIIPGMAVSMKALTENAALLSSVTLDYNEEIIGRDTQSAIRSGVINGNTYMIDGFIRNIREKFFSEKSDEKLSLIATGGLAQQILPYMRNKFTYYEDLTLYGLAYLYCKNRKI